MRHGQCRTEIILLQRRRSGGVRTCQRLAQQLTPLGFDPAFVLETVGGERRQQFAAIEIERP
jgi:hypothetical protein